MLMVPGQSWHIHCNVVHLLHMTCHHAKPLQYSADHLLKGRNGCQCTSQLCKGNRPQKNNTIIKQLNKMRTAMCFPLLWIWLQKYVQGTLNYPLFFNVHGSVHRESMSINVQQYATIYSLLYFCKLLYMFLVVTPPIIRSTYNCNCSIWHWSNRLCYLPLWCRSVYIRISLDSYWHISMLILIHHIITWQHVSAT